MNPGLQMSVSAERFVARGSVQTPSSAHSSAHGLKKTFWKSLKSKRKKKWRAVQRHRKRLRTTPALNPWARERPHEPPPLPNGNQPSSAVYRPVRVQQRGLGWLPRMSGGGGADRQRIPAGGTALSTGRRRE